MFNFLGGNLILMVRGYLKYFWLLLFIKGEILVDVMNENDVLIV